MALKQTPNALQAPDGSYYVALTDGAGNLAPATGGGAITGTVGIDQTTGGTTNGVVIKSTTGTTALVQASGTDGLGNGNGGLVTFAEGMVFNGTTWDRLRGTAAAGATVNLAANATGGYSYSHIAAGQATTTVKSGAGTLHTITFNSPATATNVTTVFDSTTGSGTVIAIPSVTALPFATTLTYDLAFATGLTILTATANGGDMTVTYK